MKKYLIGFSVISAVFVIAAVVFVLVINPPAPECEVRVEIPLNHSKRSTVTP